MKFVKLEEREFDKFASKHPNSSFYQSSSWGHLKEANGWSMHLLGIKNDNKIIAGTLLLSKKTPIGYDMFYAPRGFLLDYDNYEVLDFFTDNIKKYAKKRKGIFIKIDPYISYQERDINGNIVENGNNNKKAFDNLLRLGYKHFGFNIMQDTLQPRWMFVTDTKDETIDSIMKKWTLRPDKYYTNVRNLEFIHEKLIMMNYQNSKILWKKPASEENLLIDLLVIIRKCINIFIIREY